MKKEIVIFDEVLNQEVEVQRVITPAVGDYHHHDDIEPQISIGEALKQIRGEHHE